MPRDIIQLGFLLSLGGEGLQSGLRIDKLVELVETHRIAAKQDPKVLHHNSKTWPFSRDQLSCLPELLTKPRDEMSVTGFGRDALFCNIPSSQLR